MFVIRDLVANTSADLSNGLLTEYNQQQHHEELMRIILTDHPSKEQIIPHVTFTFTKEPLNLE